MNLRRVSLWLSIAGGTLVLAAAILLVSVSLGKVGTTATDADGTMVIVTRRTAPIIQDSPTVAFGWIVAALVFAVTATLLIRYGGVIGGTLVVAALGTAVVGGILTIGIYIAPGAMCFGAAALLAVVDRSTTPGS